MTPVTSSHPALRHERAFPLRIIAYYSVEGLASLGASLLMLGIFFYTERKFGWTARQNLLLATAQGVVYVFGALGASIVSGHVGRRGMLIGLNVLLACLASIALKWSSVHVVVAVLLAYTALCAAGWPALESLVSSAAPDAHALSRRVAVYNLVWSGTGAAIVAVSGTLIVRYPPGMFLVPLAVHAICAVLMIASPRERRAAPGAGEAVHPTAEPELLRVRTLAMQLSRVALPSMYAVNYALGALMPSLPVIHSISDTKMQTLVGSVWLVARWLAFALLGATTWWHTRPRTLLAAAIVMLIAFLGVTLRPSALIPSLGFTRFGDQTSMILWQILLGLAMGLIYSGSLYFGMVLSHGSTEHGGYHEALIGLGSILGPGAGAAAEFLRGDDPPAVIASVAGIILLSIVLSSIVSWRHDAG